MPNQFWRGPFQIPIETLIQEKVDGLLAAEKNISESRVASTATRLQPIAVLTGQAAGALAAIAIAENRTPRQVDPGTEQGRYLISTMDLRSRSSRTCRAMWRNGEPLNTRLFTDG